MAGGFTSSNNAASVGPGGSLSTRTETTKSTLAPEAQGILDALLSVLGSGGTASQKNDRTQRTNAVNNTAATAGQYTKDAAFADAGAAMNAKMNEVLAQLLPQLVRQAEGSGTSQNALRALLTQDAAKKAAESAATLGLSAASNYGGINANLMSVLERLTAGNDPVQAALLNALGLTKGTTSTSTGVSSGGGGGGYSMPSGSGGSAAPSVPMTGVQPQSVMLSFGPADNRSDTQIAIDSINKQGRLVNQLGSAGAYGSDWTSDYQF